MKYYSTFSTLKLDLKNQVLTLPEVVDHYLRVIEENRDLNAFIEVFADEARSMAQQIQQKIRTKKAGKLAGMVIGIKDNICYRNHGVSAASKMLERYISPYSSTVVTRLLAEDAIIIGRLNCDEFSMGASNESSYYGPVKNAADRTRVSGGSSGGAAVAVQAGLCFASLGTDTGGSVRQPAAFCGIIGLKPSYGRISRHGILSYASSFDQVGTLTRSVEDAALLLEIMAGKDEYDSTVSNYPPIAFCSDTLKDTGRKKIAYFVEALNAEGLDRDIKITFQHHIHQLKQMGHQVEPISFEYLDYVVPTYYILTMAEASSNLARYDGIHYGFRSPHAVDLESTYKKSRAEGFGMEVKRRILLGTFILSAAHYDAYYTKAQKVRRLIRDKTEELLAQYDFIMLPTTPTPAFPLGQSKDPVTNYLADIFTVQASLCGVPAISLPASTNKGGLPLALQFLTKRFAETELLAFAHDFLR
jgi:aspartyl-tRNA(Asn)/glutamyl-tRNA(Gln) amidotransferase subunit A